MQRGGAKTTDPPVPRAQQPAFLFVSAMPPLLTSLQSSSLIYCFSGEQYPSLELLFSHNSKFQIIIANPDYWQRVQRPPNTVLILFTLTQPLLLHFLSSAYHEGSQVGVLLGLGML